MNIPTNFINEFGLKEYTDPHLMPLTKVADRFKLGQIYTTRQIFFLLEKYYRKVNIDQASWITSVNKTFNELVNYGFFTYQDGFYKRTHDFYRAK